MAILLYAMGGCSRGSERTVREVDPEIIELLSSAEEEAESGEYRAALALADSAVLRSPKLPNVHHVRGNILTDLNRLEEAKAAYEEALRVDERFPGPHFKLGNNAFMRGRYGEAVRAYEREEALLSELRKRSPATNRHDPATLARVILQKGRAYKLLGQVDSARAAYERSLKIDSTNGTTYAWLGELDAEEGANDRALERFRRAVEISPGDLDFRYEFGSALLKTGDVEAAEGVFRSVLAQRRSHEGANYSLGQALLRQGKTEEAQRFLDRADALQNLQAEIAAAQAAAYQQPDRPARWLELTRLLLVAGRLDEARQAMGVAHYLRPNDVNIQNDIANTSLAMGDTLAAVRRYESIVSRDSTFADGWLNLGVVHAMQGNYEAARSAWQRALRIEPGHAEARDYLSRLEP